MPQFVFSLQRALEFRERREQECQLAYATANLAMQRATEVRDRWGQRREELHLMIREHHAELDAMALTMTFAHCEYLERQIRAQETLIARLQGEAQEALARLLDAVKERQVLATLKDRRREAFEIELAAREQRELDDLNARRYDRASLWAEGIR
jgi:flagellar export protein FliJ